MSENSASKELDWFKLVSDEYDRVDEQKEREDKDKLEQRSKEIIQIQPRIQRRAQKNRVKFQWNDDNNGTTSVLSAQKKLPPMKSWQAISRNVRTVSKKTLDAMPYMKDESKIPKLEEQLNKSYSMGKREIRNLIEDKTLVMLVNNCLAKQPEIGKPAIFEIIKEMFKSSTDSKDIWKIYDRCAGIPTAPSSEVQERVDVLKSHFCRFCSIYGCKTHVAAPVPTDFERWKFWENERTAVKCSEDCYKHEVAAGGVTEWTEEEIHYFKTARKSHFDNFCRIANFIPSKNCREVFEYAQQPANHQEEPRPDEDFDVWMQIKPNKGVRQSKPFKKETKEDNEFIPCDHGGPCDSTCTCVTSGNYCEKQCRCSYLGPLFVCGNRFQGCRCEVCGTACACRIACRECDPDECKCKIENKLATEGDQGEKYCTNRGIQLNQEKRLFEYISTIPNAGYGCFTQDAIKKEEFITEYRGELLSNDERDRRSIVYDMTGTSYHFQLDNQTTVDSTNKGSLIRFANHDSVNPNSKTRNKMVNGERRIGFYALRNINAGEELFFNYGEDYPEEMLGGTKSGASKSNEREKKKPVRKIKQRESDPFQTMMMKMKQEVTTIKVEKASEDEEPMKVQKARKSSVKK